MVEELLTSRPPLLLSCCLEGNPDNMKCDAWHFYWWLPTFVGSQRVQPLVKSKRLSHVGRL